MIEVEVLQVRHLKTEEEVAKWAERHGYGMGEIPVFVAAWEAQKAADAKVAKAVTKPAKAAVTK